MFAATKRWLRNNRKGIAIGAAAIGGTYLLGQYVVGKINDAREQSALDRLAKDNIKRRFEQNQVDCSITVLALLPTLAENVIDALPAEQITHELQQKKAERQQRIADGALSEASSLRDGDTASLTSSFMHTSQLDQSMMAAGGAGMNNSGLRSRKTKAQLWNELKVTSIVRAFTMIYSLSLLILLTRIQLNLLGRLNYLSSVVSMSQPLSQEATSRISLENHEDAEAATFGNDFETNRRFLTFSWYLLHRGYSQIITQVRAAVEDVFGAISPNQGITQQRLGDLVMEVRKRVEGATQQDRYNTRWLPYVLPPRDEEESVLIESNVITPPSTSPGSSPDSKRASDAGITTGPLRHLLDEAADLVDSPSFTQLHLKNLDTMFSHLIEHRVIAQLYPQPGTQSPPPSEASSHALHLQEPDSAVTVVPGEARVKLASILAVLTRSAHLIGNGTDPPNEYISKVDAEVRELDSFAAVIYTSNVEAGIKQSQSQTNADQGRFRSASDIDASAAAATDSLANSKMVDSTLESAWEKVAGSSASLR